MSQIRYERSITANLYWRFLTVSTLVLKDIVPESDDCLDEQIPKNTRDVTEACFMGILAQMSLNSEEGYFVALQFMESLQQHLETLNSDEKVLKALLSRGTISQETINADRSLHAIASSVFITDRRPEFISDEPIPDDLDLSDPLLGAAKEHYTDPAFSPIQTAITEAGQQFE